MVGCIKEDTLEEKTRKIIRRFMHNEVSTSPMNVKGNKHQKDMLSSLTKINQDTSKGKTGNKDDLHGRKAKPKPKQTEVETQQVIGCKIRFVVGPGHENAKAFASITTTKEEVDYQF